MDCRKSRVDRRALAWTLLLWLPVPFYTCSVAYGSVPIFFPAWWPYTWYNTRYGLELLPALALGLGFAANSPLRSRCWQSPPDRATSARHRLRPPLCPSRCQRYGLVRQEPIVYAESIANLDARLPYDQAIPPLLQDLLSKFPRGTVLMNTSTYPEIVALHWHPSAPNHQ